MLSIIKRRLQDMKTVAALLEGAEDIAHQRGEQAIAEEHLLLSAVALEDGTAKQALLQAGVNPAALEQAIDKQAENALNAMGIDVSAFADAAERSKLRPCAVSEAKKLFFPANPSAQSTMKRLSKKSRFFRPDSLVSAEVLAAICETEHGVVARAFKLLGADSAKIKRFALTIAAR